MEHAIFVEKIRQQLADGEVLSAIRHLRDCVKDKDLINEIILVSSKFNSLEKAIRAGTKEEAIIEINQAQIVKSLLSILNNIEEADLAIGYLETHGDLQQDSSPKSSSQNINNNGANIGKQINISEWQGGSINIESNKGEK